MAVSLPSLLCQCPFLFDSTRFVVTHSHARPHAHAPGSDVSGKGGYLNTFSFNPERQSELFIAEKLWQEIGIACQ